MVNAPEHLPAAASQASAATIDTSHVSVSYIQPAEDSSTSELSSMDEEHFTGVPTNQISLGPDPGWMPPAAASAPTADVPPPTRASVPPTRPRVPQLARRSRPFIHHVPRYGRPFPSADNPTAPEDAYRVGYPMHTMELYHREARRDTRRYGTTRCLLGRARHAEELVWIPILWLNTQDILGAFMATLVVSAMPTDRWGISIDRDFAEEQLGEVLQGDDE